MSSRNKTRNQKLPAWLRAVAGLAFLVFVVAQGLCFLHCHSVTAIDAGDALPPCHAAAASAASGASDASDAQQGNDTGAGPGSTASCSNLQTMLAAADAPLHTPPAFPFEDLMAPLSMDADADRMAMAFAAFFSRRIRIAEDRITPEVSLDPAFLSLPPPPLG